MNITELARRLRTNPDELREKLPQLGFDVGTKAIKVDDRLVGKITHKWGEMKKLERLQVKYHKEEKLVREAVEKVKDVLLPPAITVCHSGVDEEWYSGFTERANRLRDS